MIDFYGIVGAFEKHSSIIINRAFLAHDLGEIDHLDQHTYQVPYAWDKS